MHSYIKLSRGAAEPRRVLGWTVYHTSAVFTPLISAVRIRWLIIFARFERHLFGQIWKCRRGSRYRHECKRKMCACITVPNNWILFLLFRSLDIKKKTLFGIRNEFHGGEKKENQSRQNVYQNNINWKKLSNPFANAKVNNGTVLLRI